jgi:hypothetical protein
MNDCSYLLNWDTETYNASTGNIIAWVKVPTVKTASDTSLYMCYGNSGVSTYQGFSTSTWDSNYKGVWHFPNGTTLSLADSSSNSNTGNLGGGSTYSDIATFGQIYGSAKFNQGANTAGYVGDSNLINTALVTISAWVYLTSIPAASSQLIAGFTDGLLSPTFDKDLYVDTSGKVGFYIYDGAVKTVSSVSAISTGQWTYVTATADGSNINVYINGGAPVSTAAGNSYAGYTVPNFFIGCATLTYSFLSANIDEVRVSTLARSPDWITTEYNNQSSISTFMTMGAETTSGGAVTPNAFFFGEF